MFSGKYLLSTRRLQNAKASVETSYYGSLKRFTHVHPRQSFLQYQPVKL